MSLDQIETAGEALLALLKAQGVEYLFVNAGTDFASLVEAYARQPKSGLDFPKPVICPHENLAVGMANGYTMVTGRPQAAMLHVSVGTANAVCAMMNASRDNIPLLLLAGRTPWLENEALGARNAMIHWAQEMFDQAGMLREVVKWDYELRDPANIDDVIERAISIAQAPPQGPVYLSLPREVLARNVQKQIVPKRAAIATEPAPEPAAVERLAERIARAEFPVLITSTSGKVPENVAPLSNLADRFGLGVVEQFGRYISMSGNHPMHLGYDSHSILSSADLIIVAETDVPWMPVTGMPRNDATIIQVGVDPLFSRYPIRSFRADELITTSIRNLLPALSTALEHVVRKHAPALAARKSRIAHLSSELRANRVRLIAEMEASPEMNQAWMSHCLNRAKPADAIVVNEYWSDRNFLDFDGGGKFFGFPPAGGLGWGLPAAIGACQANPEKVVFATIGDGAYYFANPAACHHTAAANDLPVVTIIRNNARWEAVEGSTRAMYPKGLAASRNHTLALSSLGPAADLESYVKASGGHGEKVEDPRALPDALKRAVKIATTERRQVVLNVICS